MANRPPVKILLIDDDPEDLELTKDVLRSCSRIKFQPTLAEGAASGLRMLCGDAFDIAFIDYEMGATDGLELLRNARNQGCKTPVILLTGHQADSLAEDALGAGVSDYLEKGNLEPSLVERVVLYAIERSRSYRELDETANRLRFLLDATPGIAWESDPDGHLLYVSKRWIDFVGDGQASRSLFDSIHPEDLDQAVASWVEAREAKTEWRTEYRIKLAEGGYRWVLTRASRAESSNRIGLTVTVDEQKELELELQQRVMERTAELEEVQQELESVSYSMVHDMRSPVRAIIATSTELLEDFESVPEEIRDGLARQKQVGRRMHALVDGMIQYIRLIRSPLNIKPIDATQTILEVERQIRSEGIMFEACLVLQPDLRLHGDPAVVKILLKALLENAAKFRPPSRPNRITVTQDPGVNGLCIRDDGIGFDLSYLGRILLPFERLHRDDEYLGVGIGLAIARRAVARHNGSLDFSASVGEGVEVCFILKA